ncbi:MAG: hypothetical protein IK955_05670 [Clostridia bacterium]|nr:hypothetical protein [Clostridia bacterium]
MRSYGETYERIIAKKSIAESKIKARNKRIKKYATAVSCLCICFVVVFLISKAGTYTSAGGSNTANDLRTEFPADRSQQTVVTQDNTTKVYEADGNTDSSVEGQILPEGNGESEAYRIRMVNAAMKALPDEDYDKIKIDESYIIEKYIKEGAQEIELCLIHLEGNTFYYEVEIDVEGKKIYDFIKKAK